MKFFLTILFIGFNLISASVRHEVVFFSSETATGRVVEITEDSLYFQHQDQKSEIVFALKNVLYVHNGEGKFFYISNKLKKFFRKNESHGGIIVTLDRQNIPFVSLSDELFMYDPRVVYYAHDSQTKGHVDLENIHKIVINHSVSQFAVRNGFYTGITLSLFSFILKFESLKQFSNIDTVFNNAFDSYPGLVTLTPLITFGWVIYDFFRGKREFVLNPHLT